jgi:hypothetical protein
MSVLGKKHVPAEGAKLLFGDRRDQLAAQVVDPRSQSCRLIIGIGQLLKNACVDDSRDIGDRLPHQASSIVQTLWIHNREGRE